ncbi:MAG: hypothetical protein SO253_03570 [Bacilli bacterium]|nr:hypothetical protein [Bacilli bacterium]
MIIKKATKKDIDKIMEIYVYAQNFMVITNNINQWQKGYPTKEMILNDIKKKILYILKENDNIEACFSFAITNDPTYDYIEGNWNKNEQYGVIHKVAKKSNIPNITRKIFNYCLTKCNYLRIDTHKDNLVMQKALFNYGFKQCGTIYLANGDKRISFDYSPSFYNKIENIKTPRDIYNFISNNISYGFIDNNKIYHSNKEMKGFRLLYRTMSLKAIFKYRCGTCIEQAYLIHYLLNKIKVKNYLYCCRIYEDETFNNFDENEHMHCFVIYKLNNKYYHLETANSETKGIHEYSSLNEAKESIIDYYISLRGGKNSPTTIFNHLPANLTFKELNCYINSIERKEKSYEL